MMNQPQDKCETAFPTNNSAIQKKRLIIDMDFLGNHTGVDAPHLSDDQAFKLLAVIREVFWALRDLGLDENPLQLQLSHKEIRRALKFMSDNIFEEIT